MRELLRSPDGAISRTEFRRGAAFAVLLTGFSALLLALIARISHAMDWMTVAVAPFMGVIILAVSLSLIYFWYCLFAKRLRGLGMPLYLLYAMLAAIVICSAARLMDYQNRTLGLATEGIVAWSGAIGTVFGFLVALFFFILLGIGWLGPDRQVPPGQCFPDVSSGDDAV
ncbi:MAG: hypothetical protein KDJ29_06210 [Hyphomicrobiales bacterium]|nr:hypothetical protein [Nitratireductor sp.]MCC2096464.1 hypothetical protein [Hyphomicrobiales bacterium]